MEKSDYKVLGYFNCVNDKINELVLAHSSLMKEINHRIIDNAGMEDLFQLESELYQMLDSELKKFKVQLKSINLKKESTRTKLLDMSTVIKNIKSITKKDVTLPMIIAGPCAIESYEALDETAKHLKGMGVKYIRGGAFKPRTSPYDFQGLKEMGLEYLHEIGKKYNMITVTEIVNTKDLKLFEKYVDIIQIGARNMHNYELLKVVGESSKPVLLKRGMSATVKEFLLAAEYIACSGNQNIILCERGIRTFEPGTRNTLDISSIPIIKQETNLPIIADVSHSIGRKDIVTQITKGILAVGADGFMVEVHRNPSQALCDSEQQLNLQEFQCLMSNLNIV
ncbi:bifunctional 3-deoxy-7-phosphoheptulonate synthase/chorismate mutase [Haloimpatiens massiliensis]|uniref:bifunctional 3-deoxy-7-phosphoheptulonate synthase/chorismate mutase n=1 Tax=Haloimpatiens massiliensis TaxID=1658110 RepID=UPI001FA8A758|nr:bifunctional 3-deoxy-7-phosphoheptulonate synthase/chorismate mutase [Haloimpatiens massiliensis]